MHEHLAARPPDHPFQAQLGDRCPAPGATSEAKRAQFGHRTAHVEDTTQKARCIC